MKNTQIFLGILSGLLLTGCVLDDPELQPEIKPLPAQEAPARQRTQAEANFSVTSEVSTKLRVTIVPGNEERSFCRKLAQRLAGRVVIDKAELVLDSNGDAQIVLDPEFELKDQSGSYYRIICNQINAKIVSNRKVYAMTTIEPKSMPRKLGLQNAKNQYLAQAADALAPFLSKELEKISNKDVAVCIVDFALANAQEQPDSRSVAIQIDKIARILNSTNGIINYTNIRQDVSRATCSFRVVFLKDQFPQGLTNVLNLKLASK